MTDLRDDLIATARKACVPQPYDPVVAIVDAILTHPRIVRIREQAAHARVDADVEATD